MTRKNWIKIWLFSLGLLVLCTGALFLCMHSQNKDHKSLENMHLAIIPHFMLASEKVDEFYVFLKDKRYADHDPDTIIILSPNHFNQRSMIPQTICETSDIYFKNKKYKLGPFPDTACDENIFYSFGNAITTNEHGIGEQLFRISKHFPEVQQIIPLVLPTHREPSELLRSAFDFTRNDNWLRIASVDFSHYLPETITQANDEISITTLKSWTWSRANFLSLDVDCPACLYFINEIATITSQHAQLRRRDSSSTILWRDMGKENTSRVFMRYK